MINYVRFVRMASMCSKVIALNIVLLAPIIIKADVLITVLNTSTLQLLKSNQPSSLTKKTERCIMCEHVIPGCVSCSQDDEFVVTCDLCDYGLFTTFDKLECQRCEHEW